ncbi:cordon-bleu protein-like 1b isoform X2 [Engraulis encrasicolus]
MDPQQQQENPLQRELTLLVVLPDGTEKTMLAHGSKPMMDLLVTLCAQHHLNPSGHTIELVSKNRNHIKFKPNALIGALEAEKILLKPKGLEEKQRRAGPHMPEATVRLVINYRKTQKTILRVSPKIPLTELLPAISEKCEFDVSTTILLRNVQSDDPLDLTRTLNDLGIREVYARDTKVTSPVVELPPSPTHHCQDALCLPSRKDKSQKEKENKENKGLFSLFRRSRKKSDQPMTASAPASPILRRQRPVSMCALPSHTSSYSSNTMPSDGPKKRRAPLPPTLCSPEATSLPGANAEAGPPSPSQGGQADGHHHQAVSRTSSAESSLRRTKRKAPPPPTASVTAPCTPTPSLAEEDAAEESSVTGIPLPATLENIREQEESPPPPSSSSVPAPSQEEEPCDGKMPAEAGEEESDPPGPKPSSNGQGGDDSSSSLNLSISLDDSMRAEASSLSHHEADMHSLSDKDTEEDQSCDLSSHGNLPRSVTSSEENAVTTHSGEAQVSLEREDDDLSGSATSPVSPTQEATAPEDLLEIPTDPMSSPQAEHPPSPPSTNDTKPPTVAEDTVSENAPEQVAGSQLASSQAEVSVSSSLEILASTPMAASTPEPEPEAESELQLTPSPTPSAGPKKDTATSTEELNSLEAASPVPDRLTPSPTPSPEVVSAPAPAPAVAPSQAQAPLAAPRGGLVYAAESKPKPKPSNEVTREYIPKVGMTTYTIVPQKSLEKLRYFEVEVTLESPPSSPPADDAKAPETKAVAPEAEVSAGPSEATCGSAEAETTQHESATTSPPAEAWPAAPPEAELALRNGAAESIGDSMAEYVVPVPPPTQTQTLTSAATAAAAAVVDGEIPGSGTEGGSTQESGPVLSPVSATAAATVAAAVAAAAAIAAEVKEKKVPPATKPKPASFRLPQHKRTPGYYVTSAAVKAASGSTGGGHKEATGGQHKEQTLAAAPQAPLQEAEEEGEEEPGEQKGTLLPPPPPPPPQEEERQQEQAVESVAATQQIQAPEDTRLSPSPSPTPSLSTTGSVLSSSPIPSLSSLPSPSPGLSPSPIPSGSPALSPTPSPAISPAATLMRQGSLPAGKSQPPSPGLSLEKLRSFAAPKPYSPSTPSRFAQAVSSAVKKSQPLPPGVGTGGHKHPLAGHSPIRDLTEPLKKNTMTDNGDKCPGVSGPEEGSVTAVSTTATTTVPTGTSGADPTRSEEPAATAPEIHGNGAAEPSDHLAAVAGVPPSVTEALQSSGEMRALHEE